MHLSLSARIIETATPRPPITEFIELARAAGYDAIGLRGWQVPPSLTAADAATVKVRLEQAGLRVFSISTEMADVARLVPVARVLGAKVIQAGGTPEQMTEAVKLLDLDMRLGPQMHTGGEFETVVSAAAVLARIPDRRIGVLVEPANLMFTGVKWTDDLLKPLAGRIIGCNLQSVEVGVGTQRLNLADGSPRLYRRVALADNTQIELAKFIRALRAAGYDDTINVIEPAREDQPNLELATATCAALRKGLG